MRDDRPTEAVHEATRDLDQREVEDVLAAIHREDRRALRALGRVLPQVARGVEILAAVLQSGGRWFNAGAGTSGRMGAIDAAEMPPTFGTPPELVQAIIAGGPVAFFRAQEGAEDDAQGARRALAERRLGGADAVVAISASGRTPFARGALACAREVGARRLAITCDPASPLAREAEVAIAPEVGPEVLAGSTRLKGGLVQKAALHLLSTAVMVRLGRVEGNLLTHLRPASDKLRRRALAILMSLRSVDETTARDLLETSSGDLREALDRALRGGS